MLIEISEKSKAGFKAAAEKLGLSLELPDLSILRPDLALYLTAQYMLSVIIEAGKDGKIHDITNHSVRKYENWFTAKNGYEPGSAGGGFSYCGCGNDFVSSSVGARLSHNSSAEGRSNAEEYPDLRLAEIFDFDAVRGLIRENAEIPPIRNNDGANAFVEHFCTLADGGPERLDQAARTEIAAGAAGPAGPAGASDRTNFRGIMSRLKKPRAAGETVGLPVRAPLMVADEQDEQDEQEGPSNAKRLRIANGNQSGGYRKTRKHKRKTRSKSRSQKRRG